MSQIFNPTTSDHRIQWSWVTLIGPDAKDFLHRLTTVDVKYLEVGKGKPGFFLNPQGKIRAYFHLWNFAPNEYAFEFDAGTSNQWKTSLLNVIDQFTFGEKLNLMDVNELDCRWIFPDEKTSSTLGIENLTPGETVAIEEEIRVSHHGNHQFGKPWITAWGRPARLNQWIDQKISDAQIISYSEIENWRMNSLFPWINHEIIEDIIPLELGMKEAIASQKGCYPGQEVIERIISMGSPPRRLVKIEGNGQVPQVGSIITNLATPPVEIGKVTSSIQTGNQFIALGMVKKIQAKEGTTVRFSSTPSSEGVIVRIAPYE